MYLEYNLELKFGFLGTALPIMGSRKFFCAWRPVPAEDIQVRSVVTGRTFRLSHSNMKKMFSSWKKIPDKEKLGQDVFRHIFMIKPSLKLLWGLETASAVDLNGNPLFRKHSRNFVTFLDIAIRELSLDSTDGTDMVNMARSVGKQHVFFK